MRDGTRQKWKSLGLGDSDGSGDDDDERARESGGKSSDERKGLNFYCDMISPSPSSSSPELSDSAAEDQVETAPCVVRSVLEVLFILLELRSSSFNFFPCLRQIFLKCGCEMTNEPLHLGQTSRFQY